MQTITLETWESHYGWKIRRPMWMKHSVVLILHMTMIQVCWHTDLQNMFLLLQRFVNLCKWQALHKAYIHTSSHKGGLCFNSAIIWGPAERSRVMKWQLKAQEDTQYKIFGAVFMDSWPAHSSMKSWRTLFSHRKSVEQIGSYSVTAEKGCLAAIAELYPCCSLAVSSQKCFEYAHHIDWNKKCRHEPYKTALTTVSSANYLGFHQLNWLQLSLNNSRSRILADHLHLNRKKRTSVSNMTLIIFRVHLSQNPCLLSSDLAHVCSTFANLTFFVRF